MKKIVAILVAIVLLVSGCSMIFDGDNIDVDVKLYEGSSGYSLNIPDTWVMDEETDNTVAFHSEDNQIAMSIVSELGGIDYYSMREIKEQLTEELAAELFSSEYNIEEDSGGTKYFHRVISGADQDGASIVVDIYASQPYVTIRHYIVVVASGAAYDSYENTIEDIISSFTITMSEDEYLQLMEDRRDAAAAAEEDAAQSTEPVEEETN